MSGMIVHIANKHYQQWAQYSKDLKETLVIWGLPEILDSYPNITKKTNINVHD